MLINSRLLASIMIFKSILLFLLLLIPLCNGQYDPTPTITTFRTVLWSTSDTTPKTYNGSLAYFPLNFNTTFPNNFKSLVSWSGYKMQTVNSLLSFKCFISSSSPTSLLLAFELHPNSEIVYAVFFVVIVRPTAALVETNYYIHTTAVLNSAPRGAGISMEQAILASSMFRFDNSNDYIIRVFLHGFTCSSGGTTEELKVVFSNLVISSINFYVNITSSSAKNNVYLNVYISSLIIHIPSFRNKLLYYSNSLLPNTTFPHNFGAPNNYARQLFSSCIFGLVEFSQNSPTARPVQIDYFNSGTSLISITNLFNVNHTFITYNILCAMECDDQHYYSGKMCVTCSTKLTGCLTCASMSVCTSCYSDFVYRGGVCVCPAGYWETTGHCTNVLGCITVQVKLGSVVCIDCDITQDLALLNGKCFCKTGFYLSDTGHCFQTCGDGILFYNACDDGNLQDGDGCSSLCRIENQYTCYNGFIISPSSCVYMGKTFKLSLVSIDKVVNKNQGKFVFKIFPAIKNFKKANWAGTVNFACDKMISISQRLYNNGEITVFVDYQQNLQGNPAKLTINFDQNVVDNLTMTFPFIMASRSSKLIVIHRYEVIKLLDYTCLGFACAALLLFVIGSFSHKMIGLQTLHTFQIIFLIHSLSNNFTEYYYQIRFMYFITGNFIPFNQAATNLYHFYQAFPFSISAKQNTTILMIVTSLLLCLIFAVLKYKQHKLRKCISPQVKQLRYKLQNITCLIYNHAIFPWVIGFMFINSIICTTIIQGDFVPLFTMIKPSGSCFFQTCIIGLMSYVFFYEWKCLLIRKNKCVHAQTCIRLEKCSPLYIPIYLTYCLLLNFLFLQDYKGLNDLSRQFTLVVVSTFLLWFIIARPYEGVLHNISQIYNIFIILLFIAWSIARDQLPGLLAEDHEMILIIAFLALLLVSLILNCIRTFFEIKARFFPTVVAEIQEDVKVNPFLLQNIFKKERFETEKFRENERKKSIQYILTDDQDKLKEKLTPKSELASNNDNNQQNKKLEALKQKMRQQLRKRRIFEKRRIIDNDF